MNYAKIRADNRSAILSRKDKIEVAKEINRAVSIENSDLINIKGVGEATVKILLENNITNQKELREAGITKVEKVINNPLSVRAINKFLNL